MLRRSTTLQRTRTVTPLFDRSSKTRNSNGPGVAAQGSMKGGVPRIYYAWMRPGSETRRRFEKMRNPFVDLDAGTSIYYRDYKEPIEAMRQEADAAGVKGMDNAVDLYNEHRIVPDLYPEGFQWQHKLNTEYNQWRSNTWYTPELIPEQHRGRLMANFQVNVTHVAMRVAVFAPKDSRQWILCSLYVGTGKGLAGHGTAVAPTVAQAKTEATKEAFENLIGVDLTDGGPVYPIRIRHDGMRVMIYPSSRLTGNCNFADAMCAFGFWHGGITVNERPRAKPSGVSKKIGAIFVAIEQMRSSVEIAHMRGKVPVSLVSNIFQYMEEVRRRKGMFATHPIGKGGEHLTPNRVVDNRLPDHLKRHYYDEKYWKDFFAGTERLNDKKIGMRSDELRGLVPPTNERPPLALAASARTTGKRRRTLADVLNRAGKGADTLGATRVVNPYLDAKLPTHAKSLFHLH